MFANGRGLPQGGHSPHEANPGCFHLNVGGHSPSRADPVAPYEAPTMSVTCADHVKREGEKAENA
jgi:hypothetical protein